MCVKCIIDPDNAANAGTHLATVAKSWKDTVAALQDASKSPEPPTPEEWAILEEDAQEMCDLKNEIHTKVRKWEDRLCTIAVAHSPHLKGGHA